MAEQLTVLGTGFAVATKCYTTCFTISDGEEHFMIDTGGGSGVLTNLETLNISYNQVHHIFLSHCHTDHVMGVVWMLRMIGQSMQKGVYEGNLHLYCHKDIADGVLSIYSATASDEYHVAVASGELNGSDRQPFRGYERYIHALTVLGQH